MGSGPAWRAMVPAVSAGGTGLSPDSLMTSPAMGTAAPAYGRKRGQRVADGAEVAARHHQGGRGEFRHPVEHGVALVEGHHGAADALDQQGVARRRAAEGDDLAQVEAASFARRRHVRREGRGEAPGRDRGDRLFRHRLAEAGKQDAGVALVEGCRVVAASAPA